jgi:hypothetical protein
MVAFIKANRALIALNLVLSVLALPFHSVKCEAAPTQIRVPSGTEIPVVISELVSSATHSSGSEILAKVATDISVSGKVIIAGGTKAGVIVESAKKNGAVGAAGQLIVSLKSTTAVDGNTIALSGTKEVQGKSSMGTAIVVTVLCCILGLLMKGENAEIVAGTQIAGRTAQETTVNVK